jgi:hypothetical protein
VIGNLGSCFYEMFGVVPFYVLSNDVLTDSARLTNSQGVGCWKVIKTKIFVILMTTILALLLEKNLTLKIENDQKNTAVFSCFIKHSKCAISENLSLLITKGDTVD